jgi:hypothetical protein
MLSPDAAGSAERLQEVIEVKFMIIVSIKLVQVFFVPYLNL